MGAAIIGRDGPAAVAPVSGALNLPAGTADVVLFTFPDRLANEAPPPFLDTVVAVRGTQGFAYGRTVRGDITMITWTERGTDYWLISKSRDVNDLVRVADSLRADP